MCRVITMFSPHSGTQLDNREKVFLVVTCSLEANVCWSEQRMAVRVRAGMQWQQHERDRQTETARRRPRHVAETSPEFPHSHQFRVTTCRLCHFLLHSRNVYHWPQPGCPLWVFCGTRSLEGISQLLGGGIWRFFFLPSWQFTRVRSVLLKQSACGQWMQCNDMLLPTCRRHNPDRGKWGECTSTSQWYS